MNNEFELEEAPTIKGHGALVLTVVFRETFLVYMTWKTSFNFIVKALVHMEVYSVNNPVN